MYIARLYYNTGFDPVNLPDSLDLLDSLGFEYKDVPAMDILQRYDMSEFRVKATEEEVIEADYLKVYEAGGKYACYTVNGYAMSSADVAILSVVIDPICSAQTIDNITITDGMLERSSSVEHYAPAQGDPLMVPSETLKLSPVKVDDKDVIFSDNESEGNYHWFIESRVEIGPYLNSIFKDPETVSAKLTRSLPKLKDGENEIVSQKTIEYTSDSATNEVQMYTEPGLYEYNENVILGVENAPSGVANIYANKKGDGTIELLASDFEVPEAEAATLYNAIAQTGQLIPKVKTIESCTGFSVPTVGKLPNPGSAIYQAAAPTQNNSGPIPQSSFLEALDNMNSLIGTDGIISSYAVPDQYVDSISRDFGEDTGCKIDTAVGKTASKTIEVGLPDLEGEDAYIDMLPTYNKSVVTAVGTGNAITVEAADCTNGKFTVKAIPDIRPNGKPYFAVISKNHSKYQMIEGSNWKDIPISFNSLSNIQAQAIGILNDSAKDFAISKARAANKVGLDTIMSDALGIVGGGFSENLTSQSVMRDGSSTQAVLTNANASSNFNPMQAVSMGMNAINSALDYMMVDTDIKNTGGIRRALSASVRAQDVRNKTAHAEIEALGIQTSFKVPAFPISASPRLADMYGNGVIVYKYSLDSKDVAKFKRIIKRFGYSCGNDVVNGPASNLLRNNEDCDYIKMSGANVDVPGIPRSVRLSIAGLLNNGVRIWHTKPVPVR